MTPGGPAAPRESARGAAASGDLSRPQPRPARPRARRAPDGLGPRDRGDGTAPRRRQPRALLSARARGAAGRRDRDARGGEGRVLALGAPGRRQPPPEVPDSSGSVSGTVVVVFFVDVGLLVVAGFSVVVVFLTVVVVFFTVVVFLTVVFAGVVVVGVMSTTL